MGRFYFDKLCTITIVKDTSGVLFHVLNSRNIKGATKNLSKNGGWNALG